MIANRTDLRRAQAVPHRRARSRGASPSGTASRCVVALIVAVGIGEAQAQAAGKPGIIATILKWTPLLRRASRSTSR